MKLSDIILMVSGHCFVWITGQGAGSRGEAGTGEGRAPESDQGHGTAADGTGSQAHPLVTSGDRPQGSTGEGIEAVSSYTAVSLSVTNADNCTYHGHWCDILDKSFH